MQYPYRALSQSYSTVFMSLLINEDFRSRSRHAKKITTGICLIFQGLFFEHNAEIGQKDHLWMATNKICIYKGSHYVKINNCRTGFMVYWRSAIRFSGDRSTCSFRRRFGLEKLDTYGCHRQKPL